MVKKILYPLVLVSITFFSTGCPRYDSVRRMSAEALNVQTKSLENKRALYSALFKLLDKQVISASVILDAETANQVKNRNSKLLLELATATDDGQKQDFIAAASKDIASYASDTAAKKQQILTNVALVKEKFTEIQNSDVEQLAAYSELDRWVQLKKVDEVMAEDVLNKFRVSQNASNKATSGATELINGLVNGGNK